MKQKTFIITKRAAGVSIKEIQEQWKSHFKRTSPEHMTIYRIYQKATSANIIESKKRNFGRKRTVRTKEVIEEIKEVLDSENDAQPQHNVNPGRSNQWVIKRGSWANIMKDIGYTQYRVRRHQELSPLNEERRLEFCKLMKKKHEDFFSNLVITDEKMFVVKGHVYSRKNCVIYSKKGEGSPKNWFSTSSVYPQKVHPGSQVSSLQGDVPARHCRGSEQGD